MSGRDILHGIQLRGVKPAVAGAATMANPAGSGPWKPCETGELSQGVIMGSVIDAAVDSTAS